MGIRSPIRSVARTAIRLPIRSVGVGGGESGPDFDIVASDGNTYYELSGTESAFYVTVSGDPNSPYGPFDTADLLGQPPVFLSPPSFTDSDGGDPELGDTLTAVSGIYLFDVAGGEPEIGWAWKLLSSGDNNATHEVTADDVSHGLGLVQSLVYSFGSVASDEIEVMAAAPYVEEGVHFDGSTNTLVKTGGFDGVVDGKTALFFVSLADDADAEDYMAILGASTDTGMQVWSRYNTTLVIGAARDESGTAAVNMAVSGIPSKGTRYALLFAIDADGTSKLMIKTTSGAWTLIGTDADGGGANLNWTTDWVVGARGPDLVGKFKGNVYRMALWFNVAIPDVEGEAVQDLFTEASGVTADPALSVTALGTPAMDLYGDSTTFSANRGSGGVMTLNGTLGDA